MNMKKLIAFCCAAAMLGASFAGCGSSSETTGSSSAAATSSVAESQAEAEETSTEETTSASEAILKVASPQGSATLDPVNGYDYWYHVRYGICETLMKFTEEMTPECYLAESCEMAEDKLTWTITIRDDVVFSNGEKVTADVVKKCFERAISDSNTAGTYLKCDSIEADGQVLTIKTTDPTPTLTYILADPVFIVYDASQDLSNCAEDGVIGTGPFVVSSFDSVTGNTSVVRNENYWNGEVQCAGIDFTVNSDASALSMSLVNGEFDAAYAISYTDIQQFENNSDFNILQVASGRTEFCFMNEKGLLGDEVLRQAISRAIDKETYCDVLLNGQFVVGKTPLTEALPYGYDEIEDINAYDVDSAIKLLDDAGYKDTDEDGFRETPDGEVLNLNYVTYNSRADLPIMAEAMQLDLKEIGINVTINTIDQSSAWNTFTAGEYDLLSMSISMTSSGDPQSSLNSYFTTHDEEKNANYNMYGYSNKKVDELMTELRSEFDIEKRQTLAKEIETEVMNDSAIISLCYPILNFVTTSNVSGITSHPSDFYWVSAETCKVE